MGSECPGVSTMERPHARTAMTTDAISLIYHKEEKPVKQIIKWLDKFGILESDLDYHLVRASMVIIFLFFGYQKWFQLRGAGTYSIYQ
jgi:hypothetical protein